MAALAVLPAIVLYGVLARAGRVADAERALDHLRSLVADAEMYPSRATVPFAEGEIALARGEPAEAVRHFRRSIELDDQLPTRERLAAAYVALDKTDLAMREFDEVIRFPFACWFDGQAWVWPVALVGRARLRAQLGDYDGAANDVATLLAVQEGGDDDGFARKQVEAVAAMLPPQ